MKIRPLVLLLPLLLMMGGCAVKSNYMQPVESKPVQASPDQALIVFMRPSLYGGAIQASLFTVDDGVEDFIGVSSAKTKIAYPVAAGEHRFMVIGESADFMDATVEAGKTYYAIVSPRMGFWKARFSLYPVRGDRDGKFSHRSEEFADWQEGTDWVVKAPEAERWYRENQADIERKYRAYIKDWQNSGAAARVEATLYPDDAIN